MKFYIRHYTINDKSEDIYYKMFFNSGKILDIGCSTGNFTVQDKKNITGIDIDEDQIKIAKSRGLNVKIYDANKNLPFKKNTFDKINCRHVIEHLDDTSNNLLTFMQNIRRILKRNGKLVLITPDLRKVKFEFWHGYVHKHPFIRESLYKLAYDAGFHKIKVYNFVQGFPGIRMLYERNLITIPLIKKIEYIAGKIYGNILVLEAYK
tara:strand:- start:83 stop:703 length:621 start_codon:yes stop_codon:yes gene_type:complete